MTEEQSEPLQVLIFRLGETRRKRVNYFLKAAIIYGLVSLFMSAFHEDLRQSTIGLAVAFPILIIGAVAPIWLVIIGFEMGSEIRLIREKIAWAQARQPPGGQAAPPKDHLTAWLGFAAALIGAVATVVVTIVQTH